MCARCVSLLCPDLCLLLDLSWTRYFFPFAASTSRWRCDREIGAQDSRISARNGDCFGDTPRSRRARRALLASLGIAALGDLLSILAQFTPVSARDVLEIVSIVVISLGSVLFTVGLINICSDTVRLYPVIRRPGVGLGDIFETNRQKTRRTEGI